MRANIRLALSVVMIVGSALYGILVAANKDLAEVVAVGYIALLLTAFCVVNVWKKP